MEELVKELLKQLRKETPQKFFPEKTTEKKPTTRWSQKKTILFNLSEN